jgi:hypothetical protein
MPVHPHIMSIADETLLGRLFDSHWCVLSRTRLRYMHQMWPRQTHDNLTRLLASFLSPPSDPFIANVERELIIVFMICIGWAYVLVSVRRRPLYSPQSYQMERAWGQARQPCSLENHNRRHGDGYFQRRLY